MVKVIDDSLYEESESFDLVLSSPVGGRLGDYKRVTVVIQPDVKDGESLNPFFLSPKSISKIRTTFSQQTVQTRDDY